MEGTTLDVEFSGYSLDYKDREFNKAKKWRVHIPITVRTIKGTIDDDATELEIELSDDTVIEFSSYMRSGGTPKKTDRKDFATLTVKLEYHCPKRHDALEKFTELLEDRGSIIQAILDTYLFFRYLSAPTFSYITCK